ncbi:MAG TPA: LuxR C-terminal-related transcriptional regulator [Gaiellaceae bacterium]
MTSVLDPTAHIERLHAAGIDLELGDAKFSVPRIRPGSIARTALVNRLLAAPEGTVAAVVAPAGYGKTTLLAQWVGRERRPCAWLTLDEDDDDVGVLRASLEAVLDGLRASKWPRKPALLVLDNADVLRSRPALDTVNALIRDLPAGSTIALASRREPAIRLARLRSEGRLLELGADELAFTRREAHAALRGAGLALAEARVAELERQTEGWPAGLYLAALSLGLGTDPDEFGGDDRFVADFLQAEHLGSLPAADLRFLLRTSVLERMNAELCDAVLERTDSGRRLEALERAGLFLVPLDRHRAWYRYRRPFRECLQAELKRREPDAVPELNRRAADWCDAHGLHEAAVDYAAAAGDADRVAALVARLALPAYHAGRIASIERALRLLDDDPCLERQPDACVVGSWIHAVRGRALDAQRWADAAEAAGTPAEPQLALLRAIRSREGAEQMLADATAAVRGLGNGTLWRPTALFALGAAHLLAGDTDRADTSFADAVEAAEAARAPGLQAVALSERSLLAGARGAHADAEAHTLQARAAAGGRQLGPSVTSAIELAAAARVALRRGDREACRADLARADRLRPLLTYAIPWLSVQTRLELARAQLVLAETEAARSLLVEVDEILRRRPGLGVLVDEAAELRRQVHALDEPAGRWASSLTAAELRLLPLLATHLSFQEIGEQLFVSRNTVKTQAISVYRKFGVSNRSGAIERAVALGLVEPQAPAPGHREVAAPGARPRA